MPADPVRSFIQYTVHRIPMNVVFVVRVAVYTENVVFFVFNSSTSEVYRSLLFLSAGVGMVCLSRSALLAG